MTTIRIMKPIDLPDVYEVEKLAYQFPWQESIFHSAVKKHYCIVAEQLLDNGKTEVVGYAIMSSVLDEASILNIVVSPNHQKKGIGQLLLSNMLDEAVERGCVNVFLEVRASNKSAYQLYVKNEFDEIGVRKNYYPSEDGREDAILLARAL